MAAEMKIRRMSDVQLQEVVWLWKPYIPFGKITIIQGDGGDNYIVAASDGTETVVKNGGKLSLLDGKVGSVGAAGDSGAAGEKGVHCNKSHCGQWATSGKNGQPGSPGGTGDAGKIVNVPLKISCAIFTPFTSFYDLKQSRSISLQ